MVVSLIGIYIQGVYHERNECRKKNEYKTLRIILLFCLGQYSSRVCDLIASIMYLIYYERSDGGKPSSNLYR